MLEIKTIKKLADLLSIPPAELSQLAVDIHLEYAQFVQSKRCGQSRVISAPTERLKLVQRRIYRRLLADLPLPSQIHGGAKGRSILTATSPHAGKRRILSVDIEDFFPSITDLMVFQIIRHELACLPEVAGLLTRLCTFNRQLPQGAPTSMALSNLALLPADRKILPALGRLDPGIVYTRYADDLIISADDLDYGAVLEILVEALRPDGLKIHRGSQKRRLMSRGARQQALGLQICNRVKVDRRWLRKLRADIHTFRISEDPSAHQRAVIEGKLLFLGQVDPNRVSKMRCPFDAVLASQEAELRVS